MSFEDAISKTTSPIMAVVEPSERLNDAGDPVSEEVTAANERSKEVDEEAQRASEAANPVGEGERTRQVIEATIPPDKSCEQENEVPSHVESIEAGTTPKTPLQITDIGDAPKNATRTAITEVEKSEITANQLWAPFVLRPAAILLFIGAFMIISICTIIFFIASNKHNGIASVNSNYYYLWTYGPTAVFVLIGSFWAQVQYRALEIMPWLLMSSGFVSASESVSLDYISPWNVKSLIKTLKKKHFLATLAINGTLLIKLATVFATGMFSTSLSNIASTTSFTKETTFNNSYVSSPGQIRNEDIFPLLSTYVDNQFNTTPPLGSNSNHVFEVFDDGSMANGSPYTYNRSYQATVNVLTTDLTCEEATATAALVNFTSNGSTTTPTIVTLRAQSCSINLTLDATGSFQIVPVLDEYLTQFMVSGCSDETDYFNLSLCLIGQETPKDGVLWGYFTAPESDNSAAFYEVPTLNPDNSTSVVNQRYSAIMCTPKVETSLGQVTINRDFSTGEIFSEVAIQVSSEIPGLALNSSSIPLPQALLYQSYCPIPWFFEGGIGTSLTFANTTNDDISSLSDATVFASNVRAGVASVMAQAARTYLMVPSNDTVLGTVFGPDVRLTIQPVSFGMMIAALCFAIINCGVLLLRYIPCRVCSRDPGSIGALATILARSNAASQAFQETNSLSTESLYHLLKDKKYRTKIGDHGEFFIELDDDSPNRKIDRLSDIKWWTPFSLTVASFLITLLLPIALIVVMEALLHISTQSDGITYLDDKSYLRYPWRFLPALAALCVQSLFGSLAFSVRTLEAYRLLRKGKAPKWAVMENTQRKSDVWAFADSLFKRQWAVFFAILPVLLAPLLPIAVSGLYTPITTLANLSGNATVLDKFSLVQSIQEDTFNITEANSTVTRPYYDTDQNNSFGIEAFAGDMILVLNRSYPQWTYSKYAFSQIKLDERIWSTALLYQESFSVVLPAVYVNMNCSLLPAGNYEVVPVNISVYPPLPGYAMIYQNLGPENCQFGNTTALSPHVNTTLPADYWAVAWSASASNTSISCPTMMFAFGKKEGNAVSTNQASVIQCRPRIEAVDLKVVLSYPSLGVDLTVTPEPVEDTKQVLFDASFDTNSVSVVPTINNFLELEGNGLPNVNTDTDPEAFFQAMIYGLNGTSPDELATNSEALIEGVQRIYGIITAQLINLNGRQSYVAKTTATQEERPVISGQFHLILPRLTQSVISTRILEALLVAMVASGLVTVCLVIKDRQIVPKSPYTIAAVWSLLAGSKMLGEDFIPPGSEWYNDEQLKSRGVLEGRSFRLGDFKNGEDHVQFRSPFRLDIDDT